MDKLKDSLMSGKAQLGLAGCQESTTDTSSAAAEGLLLTLNLFLSKAFKVLVFVIG